MDQASVQRVMLTLAGCLDSYHDFDGERGGYNVTSILQQEIDRVIGPLDQSYSNFITTHKENSEAGTGQLLNLGGGDFNYECTVSTPDKNLQSLTEIFRQVGYTVSTDGSQDMIYVVCDAGPLHISSLGKNVSSLINLVHLVTPATACDSAGAKRGAAFNKPVIFMDGNDNTPSNAAFFSMSSIHETSSPYDTNTPIVDATIHITARDGVDRSIVINSSGKGPSVDMLNAAIARGTAGRYALNRFNRSELFDIKRCADFNQIKHSYIIKLRNPNMRIVFVTIDRICAFIAVFFFNLPTILQTCNKNNKYFKIWPERNPQVWLAAQVAAITALTQAAPQVQQWQQQAQPNPTGMEEDFGGGFKLKRGGFKLKGGDDKDYEEYENDNRQNYDTEQDYINLLASLAADKLRSYISTNNPALAAACSYYTIDAFNGYPKIQDKYIEAHHNIYARLGYPATGPAAEAKKRHLPIFDFRTLLPIDYTQQIADIKEQFVELYGVEGETKFLSDKPIAQQVNSLLFNPETSSLQFLSLAIFSDFVEFSNNPGMSVISRFVFNEFLPMNPHISDLTGWSAAEQRAYHQLLTNIIPIALKNGTLSKQSLGLAGGNKKTFRRRRNRNKKTSRNKLRKRKHI